MAKSTIEQRFMTELSRIQTPEEFLGIARLLKVKLVEVGDEEKVIVRDFSDIFSDVMDSYAAAPSKRKKELLSILRAANKGGDINGN